MQRRFHRADRGPENRGDLLEREVEDVLQHYGGPLLRCEQLQQRAARVAYRAGRRARIGWRIDGRERASLDAPPPDGVDPQVARDPQEVGARLADSVVNLTERRQGAHQRILDEILGVPDVPGEAAAVAVQRGAKWGEQIEVAMPRRPQVVSQAVRQLEVAHDQLQTGRTSIEPYARGMRLAHPTAS